MKAENRSCINPFMDYHEITLFHFMFSFRTSRVYSLKNFLQIFDYNANACVSCFILKQVRVNLGYLLCLAARFGAKKICTTESLTVVISALLHV